MRDERLDYSYRNFSRTDTFDVSRQQLKDSIRLLFFHYGRWFQGATDRVARDAFEVYVARYGDQPLG